MSGIPNTQKAFAVLSIKPRGGNVPPDTIKTRCEEIPGVGAVRVDADRGKIHILYDGTVSAIKKIEYTLQGLGHSIRHPHETPSPSPQSQDS